ncbi:hypothetical protein Tco_1050683 [Tanacetum coccineum]
MAEEIKKLVEGSENVQENVEVENIVEISQPVNVIKEEEESADDDYELKQREKEKHVEEIRNTPSPTTIRSFRIQSTLVSLDTEKLQELILDVTDDTKASFKNYKDDIGLILEREKSQADVDKMIVESVQQERENLCSEISSQTNDAIANHIPSQVDSSVRSYMTGHILHVHPAKDTPPSTQEQQSQLYLTMKDDPQHSVVHPRYQDDPHDDAHPKGENSAKRPKTPEHETFVFGESSSSQDYESEPDDDVLPNEKVSQEFINEMSQTVDEAKLRKVVDEMLRQQCTLGDDHQYHIDQMQNFLKSDIVWETPALSLANQDLLYLKKGNTGLEKIALSLHKFPAVKFPDNDIEERTSR